MRFLCNEPRETPINFGRKRLHALPLKLWEMCLFTWTNYSIFSEIHFARWQSLKWWMEVVHGNKGKPCNFMPICSVWLHFELRHTSRTRFRRNAPNELLFFSCIISTNNKVTQTTLFGQSSQCGVKYLRPRFSKLHILLLSITKRKKRRHSNENWQACLIGIYYWEPWIKEWLQNIPMWSWVQKYFV